MYQPPSPPPRGAATAQSLIGSARLPSVAHIRAFEAAVRLGSFERASDELAVTPSAVSKRVAALESLLGLKLLCRVGRGVEPTAGGKEYLEQVSVALGLLARSTFHRRSSVAQQRLRITLPPTFGREVLIPHLTEFTQLHPNIELELMLSIPYLDISAPGCDLEIRFGEGAFDALESERLVDETVFPVCSAGYRAQCGGLERPDDLRNALLLRGPLEPWQPWLDAAGLDLREPESGHRIVDLGMMVEAAINHQGVALARRSLARRALQQGLLVQPFAIESRPRYFYFVCWHRKHGVDEAKGKFIDWLKTVCANAAAA
jgi:DNA-binding transcriptional LysR family regulator